MEPESIEELFERWRSKGDVDALAAVFDRTAGELYPLAHLLGRDEAEAEDLLQETFLAAIERSASWDNTLPLRPWLVGILSVAARRQRRARARKPEPELLDEREAPLPESGASERELDERLAGALADLPTDTRRLLEMRLIEGRAAVDIARELGRAPGTVRMQLLRALEDLRKRLPPSLALGVAGFAFERRGIADARELVLQAARSHAAPLAVSATSAPALSLMSASAAAVLAGVVLVSCWIASAPHRDPAVEQQATVAPQGAQSGRAGELALVADAADPRPSRSVTKTLTRDSRTSGERMHRPLVIGPAPAEGEFVGPAPDPLHADVNLHLRIECLGQPVEAVGVLHLFEDAGFEGGICDERGRIEIVFKTDATSRFLAQKLGYVDLAFEVDPHAIRSGDERVLELQTAPAPGQVWFDVQGMPPAELVAQFFPRDLFGTELPDPAQQLDLNLWVSPRRSSRRVLADGHVVGDVPAGSYWVLLWGLDTRNCTTNPAPLTTGIELNVPAGAEQHPRVTLVLGGRLQIDARAFGAQTRSVQVTLADENLPARRLTLGAQSADGSSFSSTVVNLGGIYQTEIFAPGTHTFEIQIERGPKRIEKFEFAAGQMRTITLSP